MFFLGENDHRFNGDFRRELHDSDGLIIHSGTGEWIWRPLRNPVSPQISSFLDHDVEGFGLLQRDRNFEHYQDLDLAYELRPSYFVEPRDSWGEGHVDLVELPTQNETNDNIVASFVAENSPEPNKPFSYAYRITASLNLTRLSPNGRVINTFQTTAAALGSVEPVAPGRAASSSISAAATCPITPYDPPSSRSFRRRRKVKILRSFSCQTPTSRAFGRRSTLSLRPGNRPIFAPFCERGRGL